MCDQIKAIYECYNNLEYNEDNGEKALIELSELCKKIKFDKEDDLSIRCLKAVSLIKKNLSLFQSICTHVDIVTTIIEYLNNFEAKFLFNIYLEDEEEDEIISLMYTLFTICTEHTVQLFLKAHIIDNSKLENWVPKINCKLLNRTNEIIVLEDADLYAVIYYIKITENYLFTKIWVQQPIKVKFLSFMKEYCEHLESLVYIFRSKQELLTSAAYDKINIVSIWSEDIISAKNLAMSLNKDILFINSHMDFCGSVVLLPRVKSMVDCLCLKESDKHSICNLFYDGIWQKPAQEAYWIDNKLWSPASNKDVVKYIEGCINSAEKGVKIWGNTSIHSRIQALSKFASALECKGQFLLASVVSKWIKFAYLCENSSFSLQNGRLEVITTYKPRGVIVLIAEQLEDLFAQLTPALITGNSIIIICNGFSNFASYCDIFSTCKIPPGVINMLSKKDFNDIIDRPFYNIFERLIFKSKLEKRHANLTIRKEIILPLK